MIIPKKIKIGSQTFKIKFKKNLKSEDGTPLCGFCDTGDQIIIIDKCLPQENMESTFLHEIIEAIRCIHDIKMSHQTVSTLEAALYQVLKGNNLLKE